MVHGRDPAEIAREAEAQLCKIHGVLRARISIGPRGEVTEVHVVADSTRRGKELVRDIETVLRACFDLEVDHRCISVARVGEEAGEAVSAEGARRVRLAGVGVHITDVGGKARVDLARNGLDCAGSASGSALQGAWMRLVAAATLEAVARFLPTGHGLSLAGVHSWHLGSKQIVLVEVDFSSGKEVVPLVGCALCGPDLQRTVAKATLDAVNRLLGRQEMLSEAITYLEPPL